MLRKAQFELDGHVVRCTASSAIVADSIRRETRLMDFLREWFGNDQLALKVEVDEAAHGQRQQDEQRRPVTRHEQYHYLAAKNPLLRELQKRFKLDFD